MAESANVEVVISAFTEAAQEAVESVGDKLNNLTADASPASSAMDEVGDQMTDAAAGSQVASSAINDVGDEALDAAAKNRILRSQLDEVGDEMTGTAGRATLLSGAYSRVSASAGGLTVSTGALSAITTASLIPAFATLSTMLLPLAGALGFVAAAAGSLVAVMGGLAATGAVTHMAELKTAMKEAKAEIMEIIQPLGEVFGPLLVDAVEALPALVQNIVDSLGPLQDFADAFRELGQIAFDVIPQITGAMADLARLALPALMDLISFLRTSGAGAFDRFRQAAMELGPPLMDLADAVMGLLPDLFDIGLIVADMVIPALTSVVGIIDQVAEFVLSLDQDLRRLAIAGAITAPAILSVASSVGALLGPVGLAAAAVAAFAAAYRSNFMGIQDATDAALGDVMDILTDYAEVVQETLGVALQEAEDFVDSFTSAFEAAGGGGAIERLATNLQGYMDQVISLVQDVGAAVQPIMRTIGSTLSQNGDHFAQFAVMAVNALNGLVTVLRTVVLPTIRFVFMNFVIPLLDRLVTVWSNNFGQILTEVIETMNALVSYIRPVLQLLGAAWNRWGDEIQGVVMFIFDFIIGYIGTVLDALYTVIIVALNLIQGDWDEAWAAIADFFSDTLDGIVNFIDKWGLIEKLSGALDSVISTVESWGQSFVSGVAGFLNDIWNGFVTLFTESIPNAVISGLAALAGYVQAGMNQVYNIMVGVWDGILSIGTNAVEALINSTIDALNGFLSTLDDVANAVSEIPGVDAPNIGSLEQVSLDSSALEAQRRSTNAQRLANQVETSLDATLDLEVTGDGPLADFIDQQAEAKVDARERQQTRRTRRQGTNST